MRYALAIFLAGASAAKAQGIDFLRQDIKVDVTDSTELTVDIQLKVRAVASTSFFDFIKPAVPVRSVQINGQAVTVLSHPTYPDFLSRVRYPKPLAPIDEALVTARLKGVPRCNLQQPGVLGCVHANASTFLLPTTYDIAWYFNNLYTDPDVFDGSVTVRAPAAYKVMTGHGSRTYVDNTDGTRLWTFPFVRPHSAVHLGAGNFTVFSAGTTVKVDVLVPADQSGVEARAQAAAELGASVIPVYARLFGPLPRDNAEIILSPARLPFGGMGLLGSVMLSETAFTQLPHLIEQGVPHELAHSWWGGGLTSAKDNDEALFLHESLAEYSAWRALGELRGDDVRTAGSRMNAVWYMYRRPANQDYALTDPRLQVSPVSVHVGYHKGSVVLRTLEENAGPDAFTATLRTLASGGQGEASISAWVDELSKIAGYDPRPDVAQWLNRPGFPRLTITARRDSAKVHLNVTSRGPFQFRLPIRIRHTTRGPQHLAVLVREGENAYFFDAPSSIEAIEVDPRWTLVREIATGVPDDVTLDGEVDGRDLIEVGLRIGAVLPSERRVEGGYDPLYDLNQDRGIDVTDLETVRTH